MAIWGAAAERGCILVTKDEDFHRLSVLHGAPPKVVWLRVGNASTEDVAALMRSRREDIEPMARLLLSRVGTRTGRALRLSPEAVRVLLSYEWPGNVRELENALEFAATVCQGQTLQPEDLPPEIAAAGPAFAEEPSTPPRSRVAPTHHVEDDRELRAALEQNRWNREATARALGVSRSTLWRRMRAASLS
jgi:DNA-binding NtrC family response regulator